MRSALLLLLSLLLVSTLPAQGAAEEAVKDFRRFFRTFKETSQKVEAVQTLKGHDHPTAAKELITLLDSKEEAIRAAAMEVLSTYRSPETFAGLTAELPGLKQNEHKALLIDVLRRSHVVAALPVVRKMALEDKRIDGTVRASIARALAALGDKEAASILRNFLSDRDPLVRIATLDAARDLRIQDLGPDILPLLSDSTWQVQSAAVQCLGALRTVSAIDPLIDLMRRGGRLQEEATDALFRITAMDLPADPDQWANIMAKLRDAEWRPPTDEELAKAVEARRKSEAFYGKQSSQRTTFSGITTTSTRVLFIIDVSGSMEDLVVDRERFKDGGYRDFKRLTIVKSELARTIDELSANVHFNIVAFATDLTTFKKDLVPANIVTKAAARQWVERLQPIGGSEAQAMAADGLSASANLAAGRTNTIGALLYAFGIDAAKPVPVTPSATALRNKVDTVFFLSDGRPTVGHPLDTQEIRKVIAKLNETYRIVFHCIAIGDFQKDFMGEIARESGGVFVDLGR